MQVYATNSGQDHWLLGLQYVFKAYKDPVVTQVEMPSENLVAVAIASQVGGQLGVSFAPPAASVPRTLIR